MKSSLKIKMNLKKLINNQNDMRLTIEIFNSSFFSKIKPYFTIRNETRLENPIITCMKFFFWKKWTQKAYRWLAGSDFSFCPPMMIIINVAK